MDNNKINIFQVLDAILLHHFFYPDENIEKIIEVVLSRHGLMEDYKNYGEVMKKKVIENSILEINDKANI